jgi:hypothetical protein
MKKLFIISLIFSTFIFPDEKIRIKYDMTFANSGGIPGPLFDSKEKKFYGGSPENEGVTGNYMGRGFFTFDEENRKIYLNTRGGKFYEIDADKGIVLKVKSLYFSEGLVSDEKFIYSINGDKIQRIYKESLDYFDDFVKLPSPRKMVLKDNVLFVANFENGKWQLKKFNTETKDIIPFNSPPSINGAEMCIDEKGRLWTIWDEKNIKVYDSNSGNKLLELNLEKDRFNPKPKEFGNIFVRNNLIYIWDWEYLYSFPLNDLSKGKIILGGGSEFLNSFPQKTYGRHSQIYVDDEGDIYISFGIGFSFFARYPTVYGGKQYPKWFINFSDTIGFNIDNKGNLWTSVRLGGVICYDGKTAVPLIRIPGIGGYGSDILCDEKGNKFICGIADHGSLIDVITDDYTVKSSEMIEKTSFTSIAKDELFIYVTSNKNCISKFIDDMPPEWQQDILPQGLTLNRPSGLEVDDRFLYVSDTENKRIIKFEKYSPFKVQWISEGFFEGPCDLSLYKDYLFVCDYKKNKIIVLDKNTGSLISEIGETGKHGDKPITYKFNSPRYLKVIETDNQVYLYVSDNLQGVRRFKVEFLK